MVFLFVLTSLFLAVISDAYSFTHVAMEYAEEQRAERLARAEEAKKVKAKKDN